VRELPNGEVLVNDAASRRLLIFDQTLSSCRVVLDSVPGSRTSYPQIPIAIVPFLGDSLAYADFQSQTLVVLDPAGRPGRTFALPKPADFDNLLRSFSSVSRLLGGGDRAGGFIYEGSDPGNSAPPGSDRLRAMVRGLTPRQRTDSAPIVRADFEERILDTLTMIRIPGPVRTRLERDEKGKPREVIFKNPVGDVIDGWDLTSDGWLAVVRGSDYHVDWFGPNGSHASSPRLPYDWRRLTDRDKELKLDSARKVLDSVLAANAGRSNIRYELVPADSLPEYVPPIRLGAVRADLNMNIWVLPATSAHSGGGLVYDVINREFGLRERVALPRDRRIGGFGKGGTLYLLHGDRHSGIQIERVMVLRRIP
jgi:hypothetical protein